jgi:hypothetical protein
MVRTLAAALLAVHGLIHLIGFVVPWGIAQVEGFPYRTSALAGAIALGEPGARLVGAAWLVLAVGFVIAGVATWRRAPWAAPLTAVLAVGSIVVCTMGLPVAVFGIVVDVAILAALGWAAVARGSTVQATG